jgi:hypothetical protein
MEQDVSVCMHECLLCAKSFSVYRMLLVPISVEDAQQYIGLLIGTVSAVDFTLVTEQGLWQHVSKICDRDNPS